MALCLNLLALHLKFMYREFFLIVNKNYILELRYFNLNKILKISKEILKLFIILFLT